MAAVRDGADKVISGFGRPADLMAAHSPAFLDRLGGKTQFRHAGEDYVVPFYRSIPVFSDTLRYTSMVAICMALPLKAEPLNCPGGRVSTEHAGDAAELICSAAARATDQLASCNLEVPEQITITVTDELPDQCLGVYHCGQGHIEILAPEAYAPVRAAGAASAFALISDDAFFESVIRHELAHAALDDMPCPFPSCIVGQEYIAYAMQIRFLPDADRAAFEEATTQVGPVSRDMLSHIMLMMAPESFARRVWLHLQDRDDPCTFIGQISRAEVLLDREHP